MAEAKKFAERYADVDGFEILGMTDFHYPFMNDTYSGEYDADLINVVSLDIETMSDDGFPEPALADKAITAITMKMRDTIVVIGKGHYEPHQNNIRYINCEDEELLLQTFVEEFAKLDPDVIIGWNVDKFDVTYLVNRIRKILSEKWVKRLSPWGIVQTRKKKDAEKNEYEGYDIYGVVVMDYMDLYKKWTFTKRESYSLDFIGQVEELDAVKIDYKDLGYTNLHDLYTRNYQLYIEYNVRDTEVVQLLEDKLKLLSLVFAISYQAKVNYNDTFSPVKTWDVIIHNFLMQSNTVIPMKIHSSSDAEDFSGGFVKQPVPGLYEWVVSEDLDSLYPHNIMQNNISPEMYRGKLDLPGLTFDAILNGKLKEPEIARYLKDNNLAIAPNRTLWSREKQGFLAHLMETFYVERKQFKAMSIENKKKYEATHDPEFKKLATLYDVIQQARKVLLNSAYGALANAFFRWFNIDFAEAVTTTGQLVIQVISREVNKYFNTVCGTVDIDYVIANDTDSMYLNFAGIVKKFCNGMSKNEIVDFIDKTCKEALEPFLKKNFYKIAEETNAFEMKMNMKREAISDRGIWTGKKMYILNMYDLEGVRFEKPKLKFVGLAVVRSSTPAICREKIKQAIHIVMNGDNAELIEYIDNFRQEFNTLPFETVAFPRGLNKMQDYYDPIMRWQNRTPVQLKGAFIYNELIDQRGLQKVYPKLRNGDKIKFAYLKEPNPTRDKVLTLPGPMPPELEDLNQYICHFTQFEKAFIKPLSSILDVIGWQTEYKPQLDCF
jgi:DNA polymerase elongation subunit (family B)